MQKGWLRDTANAMPDTTKCANLEDGGSRSSCCMQLSVQGESYI